MDIKYTEAITEPKPTPFSKWCEDNRLSILITLKTYNSGSKCYYATLNPTCYLDNHKHTSNMGLVETAVARSKDTTGSIFNLVYLLNRCNYIYYLKPRRYWFSKQIEIKIPYKLYLDIEIPNP